MVRFNDQKVWEEIEQREIKQPSPRKVLADREIYRSYSPVAPLGGVPHVIDFGAARLGGMGQMHSGDTMLWKYRAPKIILGLGWDDKVDIWSVGMMVRSCSGHLATTEPELSSAIQIWNLLEGDSLFGGRQQGRPSDEQHLAEMVSLIGPPPKAFLERTTKCSQYWDSEGLC